MTGKGQDDNSARGCVAGTRGLTGKPDAPPASHRALDPVRGFRAARRGGAGGRGGGGRLDPRGRDGRAFRAQHHHRAGRGEGAAPSGEETARRAFDDFAARGREKTRRLRARAAGRPIDMEVDGGITPETAPAVVAAGANVLVAGTAVFKGGNPESYRANIAALRNAAAMARGEAA